MDGEFYMWMMVGRPCEPDSDLNRLWRLLLPGTQFPACGVLESADVDVSGDAGLAPDQPDSTESHSERGKDKALDAT